jgi:WD40 repeat protein
LDNIIRVWDASTGIEMFPPREDVYEVWSIAFSCDGSKIMIHPSFPQAQIWDANTGVQLVPVGFGHEAVDFVSSPTLDNIISVCDGWFKNINTGRCLARLPVGASYYFGCESQSCVVVWTEGTHKPVIIQFPVEYRLPFN